MSRLAPAVTAPVDGAPADLEGFVHHFAEVNGTRIHYVSGGAGPAIVLLHGWPLTWREWRGIMPALAEAGFTVIAPDLRGLGDSERPSHDYDKKTVADDIRHIVRGSRVQLHRPCRDGHRHDGGGVMGAAPPGRDPAPVCWRNRLSRASAWRS